MVITYLDISIFYFLLILWTEIMKKILVSWSKTWPSPHFNFLLDLARFSKLSICRNCLLDGIFIQILQNWKLHFLPSLMMIISSLTRFFQQKVKTVDMFKITDGGVNFSSKESFWVKETGSFRLKCRASSWFRRCT